MRMFRYVAAAVVVLAAALAFEVPTPAAVADDVTTITLITGDRVTLPAAGPLRIEPGEGREDVGFAVHESGDRLDVIPTDALPLVAAGRLDVRLFDVVGLQRMGYGDADRQDLPLIVEGDAREARAAGAETSPLLAADAAAVALPKARAGDLWSDITDGGVEGRVWLDGLVQPALDVSVPHIGAPTAWAAGYTGEGVTVAVVDTGIDDGHPDLSGRLVERRNFTAEPVGDQIGHGTHVAATVAGSFGVAPDAALLDAKVCMTIGCEESAVIAGMQWAADEGAAIVNLSLGGGDTPGTDPVEAAVDNLSAQYGTLFVVAAGNAGPVGLSSPATADAALAVGAVDDTDRTAEFSSSGPRIGDGAIKPDISAPGVAITAAEAGTTGHVDMDGTSMATPHVAGAAALLSQQHPNWSGSQMKAHLMGAAQSSADVFGQGAGRVDVAQAVRQTAHAEPASVSFGIQRWPHHDDEVLTRTITYTNAGTEPLRLSLRVEGADAFTLTANEVTVPAGGTAGVDVRADTRGAGPEGPVTAHVVASGAAAVLTTPVAIIKEVESYDLTVANLGLDGQPAGSAATLIFGLDSFFFDVVGDVDGRPTLRVPKGRYLLESYVPTNGELGTAQLVQPLAVISADTTIELDARQARPFAVDFERDAVAWKAGLVSYIRRSTYTLRSTFYLGDSGLDNLTTAHFGPEVGEDEMRSLLQGTWAIPDGTRVYNLAWYEHGRMMTGITRHVEDAPLARVAADYRAAGDDRTGIQYPMASMPEDAELEFHPISDGFEFPLPQRRTELYNTDDGVLWASEFDQLGESGHFGVAQVLLPGRSYRTRWNGAVLGPTVSFGSPTDEHCPNLAQRIEDSLIVSVPVLTDADGHAGCPSEDASATSRLRRNGEVIGEAPFPGGGVFEVPPEPATYRLETEVDRGGAAVSTRVAAAWTFRSEHVEAAPIPLLAVRFRPDVDHRNRAPAGMTVAVPVTIDRAGPIGRISKPTVEVSFDDGATWTPVTVERQGHGTYLAIVTHPSTALHVSLRATASDDRGNTVEQTIHRAYLLK